MAKKVPRQASLPLQSSTESSDPLHPYWQPRLDLQERLKATANKQPRRPRSPARLVSTTSTVSAVSVEKNWLEGSDEYLQSLEEGDSLGSMTDVERIEVPEIREAGRHRDSLVNRVASRLNSPSGDPKRRKSRRSRRLSTSSALSHSNSIAAALAKSGLQIASPGDQDIAKAGSVRAVSTGRSPYLLNPHDYDSDDDGYGTEDDSVEGSDLEGDHLPVTGFAVASNRRNAEFHALFPTVDEGDYLIEGECIRGGSVLTNRLRLRAGQGYPCSRKALCLGEPHLLPLQSVRLGYKREQSFCAMAADSKVVVPFLEVLEIEKKMTALVIPNAIGVVTKKEKVCQSGC